MFLLLIFFYIMPSSLIFDFDKNSDLSNWFVMDDVVMGGRSSGNMALNEEGHAEYSGSVSLENNGGFSSLRYRFEAMEVNPKQKLMMRIKGDGKRYQIRVKTNASDYYSYIGYIETSGAWETVEVQLKSLYPSFRGRKLQKPNFSSNSMEELGILVGNKKAEDFHLLIDRIELK